MTSGEEGAWDNRLKAKEKILVQLYLHTSEPDAGVFPFEVTQKGLSECLGLRRSHVAMALQELAKDDLVEVCKGHIYGGQRRQNAYCITAKGYEFAADTRARLVSMRVQFETPEGTKTVKVEEILSTGNVSLASVIFQMDKGGPVRAEITVVTRPEKKLISVFCPTCKKQIEVDNFFIDEEVGFDCPGCGRPYKIVPALKTETPARAPTSAKNRSATIVAAILLSAIMFSTLFVFESVCVGAIFVLAGVVSLAAWLVLRTKEKVVPQPRSPTGAVVLILMTGAVLLLLWHLFIASIEIYEELKLASIVFAGLAACYVVVTLKLPDLRGDYMVASGTVLILVAASTMFVVNFGDLGVGTAPFLGIAGAILFALSTFQPLDRDARILGAGAGAGAFLLLITVVVVLPACGEAIDYVAAGATVLLGLLLVGLRAARETTGSKDISTHLIASLPLPGAAAMLIFGLALIDAGSEVAGLIELGIMAPIAYFGLREVFNDNWVYRAPIAAFITGFAVLVLTAGIVA